MMTPGHPCAARLPLSLLAAWLALAIWAGPTTAQPAPRVPDLNVNTNDFPDSSLVDFSTLRSRPTGKHGEMFTGNDGRFYFEDGTRARFWGVNIAKNSVFVTKPLIDQAINTIDRAGFNMVRFHHLDDVQGLLPAETAGTAERIDPAKLASLDYWIAELGKRGIYVYLDLLDYRTFYESEDVPKGPSLGRGAKPYAFFDRRLIILQQQYARKLLIDHVNPYTGRSYADDPTVALLELCDENGLFITARKWQEMVSPYREDLQRRFNDWLKQRYTDTATLKEAWTDADGRQGLLAGESLEQGTVRLFPPAVRPGGVPSPTRAGLTDPEEGQVGRVADRRLFFVSVQEQYFKAMRDYLRNHGVKQPVTAVTDARHLSDLRSVANRLDFVGQNFYYDHPMWAKGNDWRLPGYFENTNPLADPRLETFVPRACSGRVYGKPLVVREWNVCWPNKFRACGLFEAAVYGALQDIDGMLLFTYDIRPGLRRLEFFDVSSDPARWGLSALCASLFLKRQVAPARRQAAIAYSTVDTHFPTFQQLPTEIYRLGWVSQVSNLFFDDKLDKRPDLTIASGRTSGSAYPGSRTIICSNWPNMDLLDHQRGKAADQLSGYEVATVPEKTQEFTFGGTMFAKGETRRLTASPGYLLADVQHHPDLRPLGVGADNEASLGFRDMTRNNYVFRQLNASLQLRVALDALGQIYDDKVSHSFVDTGRYVSDTGQVRRLIGSELLLVDAPQAQGIAGNLQNSGQTRTSALSLTTNNPLGVLLWLSLDGKPAATSTRWVLKMVTTAVNTGEVKSLHYSNPERTMYALTELGKAPVSTLGAASEAPTTVVLADKPVLQAYLTGGTWELLCEGGKYTLYCDTPGMRFSLPRLAGTVRVDQPGSAGEPARLTQPFVYPAGARVLEIRNP